MSSSTAGPKTSSGRCYLFAGIILAVQGASFYALPPCPDRPLKAPLSVLSTQLGDWTAVRETPISSSVADVLKADDTLNRDYANAARNSSVNLFIAYFGSQRVGRWPHSPQYCMPGAGWVPESLSTVPVSLPSRPGPIGINRFILARGTDEVIVHYWYESRNRVIATEFMAKIYLVLDSIRYRRSDTSLVRITTQVPNAAARDAAIDEGMRFVQACFEPVRELVD